MVYNFEKLSKMLHLGVLIGILLISWLTAQPCGRPRVCQCRGYLVDCRRQGLDKIPTLDLHHANGPRLIDMRNNTIRNMTNLHQFVQDKFLETWTVRVAGNPLDCDHIGQHLWERIVDLTCEIDSGKKFTDTTQEPARTVRSPNLGATRSVTQTLASVWGPTPRGKTTTDVSKPFATSKRLTGVTQHPFFQMYDQDETAGEDDWTLKEIIAIAISVPVAIMSLIILIILVKLVKTRIIHL